MLTILHFYQVCQVTWDHHHSQVGNLDRMLPRGSIPTKLLQLRLAVNQFHDGRPTAPNLWTRVSHWHRWLSTERVAQLTAPPNLYLQTRNIFLTILMITFVLHWIKSYHILMITLCLFTLSPTFSWGILTCLSFPLPCFDPQCRYGIKGTREAVLLADAIKRR